MLRIKATLLCCALLGLAACATTAKPGAAPDPMGTALQQPMRDLSLIRDQVPPTLLAAAAAPYNFDPAVDCEGLAREIATLDAVLGPDVDESAAGRKSSGGLAGDLLSGALGLPYRGIVRTVTGAAQRARELKAASLAGMVRRGFLQGRQGAACGRKIAASGH
ncbi:MAG: hypothetical protein ACHP7A_06130 [Caulobacterales bacterium]